MANAPSSRTKRKPDRKYLEDYLHAEVSRGKQYFKSKAIAKDIELSAKQIGSLLYRLSEESTRLEITKWSSTSSVTWLIEHR